MEKKGLPGKAPVHKCYSDPARRTSDATVSTRKCVLFLEDGYSYYIVAQPPEERQPPGSGSEPPIEGRPPVEPRAIQPADNTQPLPALPLRQSTPPQHPSPQRFAADGVQPAAGSAGSPSAAAPNPTILGAPGRNGQLSGQGSLTIVRRSSQKKSPSASGGGGSPISMAASSSAASTAISSSASSDDVELAYLATVDLHCDFLPAVDTPDACDKAALRLRSIVRRLQSGHVSAELLQSNLLYAAKVLETVYVDEARTHAEADPTKTAAPTVPVVAPPTATTTPTPNASSKTPAPMQRRRLHKPTWARRLADDDDELSEVQPDAVPPEVRDWLASTFTRQLATQRRRPDEKPKFRSVAHAIRAGIFVDRIYRRVSSATLMQFPPEVVAVLKKLDDWSFDVFGLSEAAAGQPIKYLGYDLFNRYGIIHKFKVPPGVLETLLGRIEEGYNRHQNPYHNNLHAADVAQSLHYMLCQSGLMNWLTDLEIFATLLAALIHDYEHTGTTNNFHVMSGSDTALLYNDRAVLENHHVSAAFRLLKEEDCNILQNLSREEFREFRTLVIDMVLATDMSFHFQQLKNMKNLLTLAEPSLDKSKALSLVLHCCDIAHPAKHWDLHRRWTALLLEEFFRQGDRERALGLPFSPLCDRNNTLVAESQIGFIEFIVEPSMAVCADMLEVALAPILAPCKDTASSIAEESDQPPSGATTTNSEKPSSALRFTIKKPWVAILTDNKRLWKDQAAKDAELRAHQKQVSTDEDAAADTGVTTSTE